MAEHTTTEKPQNIMAFDFSRERDARPQSYYDDIKERFAAERDLRLTYRPPGTEQYTSELRDLPLRHRPVRRRGHRT